MIGSRFVISLISTRLQHLSLKRSSTANSNVDNNSKRNYFDWSVVSERDNESKSYTTTSVSKNDRLSTSINNNNILSFCKSLFYECM